MPRLVLARSPGPIIAFTVPPRSTKPASCVTCKKRNVPDCALKVDFSVNLKLQTLRICHSLKYSPLHLVITHYSNL